jgi:DNA-binding MarR family transcriptional regulator
MLISMTTKAAQICNCFAIRQAARVITQIYDRHVRQSGITGSQYTILAVLQSLPDMAMSALAEELMMDRTSLVRALQPLIRDGLVVSDSSGSAIKKASVRLTPAGEEKMAEAEMYWKDAQDEWEKKVGAKRAKALRDELNHVTHL